MRRPAWIARHSARPSGLLGRIVARVMARDTAADNERLLDLLELDGDERVLEIGCGHGRTLRRLACRCPRGRITGIDHAPAMVRMARRVAASIDEPGRMTVHRADSADLPLEDKSHDVALAVHTVYFWRDAAPHLREIRRVLVPGGRFLLGFHSRSTPGQVSDFPPSVYTHRDVDEVVTGLERAGFDEIRSGRTEGGGKPLDWVLGRRSSSPSPAQSLPRETSTRVPRDVRPSGRLRATRHRPGGLRPTTVGQPSGCTPWKTNLSRSTVSPE